MNGSGGQKLLPVLGFRYQAQLQRSCVLESMGSTESNPQDYSVMHVKVPTGAEEEVGWEVNSGQ